MTSLESNAIAIIFVHLVDQSIEIFPRMTAEESPPGINYGKVNSSSASIRHSYRFAKHGT